MPTRAKNLLSIALSLIAGSLVYGAFLRLPLSHDGARYFFSLADRSFFQIDHYRVGMGVFQIPTLMAIQAGLDVWTNTLVFSLSILAMPLIALLLSWKILKPNPDIHHLIVWPFLSAGLIVAWDCNIPGSEPSLIAHAMWPILFSFLVRPGRGHWYVWILLLICIGLHSLTAVLLFTLSLQSVLQLRNPQNPKRALAWLSIVSILVGALLLIPRDNYEAQRGSFSYLIEAFFQDVWGLRFVGVCLGIGIGCILLFDRFWKRKSPGFLIPLAIMFLIFLAIEVLWLGSNESFRFPSRFRYFVLFMLQPLVILCWRDFGLIGNSVVSRAEWNLRSIFGIAMPALSFTLMMVCQANHWNGDLSKLTHLLRSSPRRCFSFQDLKGRFSAIGDAYTPALSILVQNSFKPEKLFVPNASECDAKDFRLRALRVLRSRPAGHGNFDLSRAGIEVHSLIL